MALNDQHFRLFDLPELPETTLEEFETLPLDEYCGGKFRRRRFSQYRLVFDGGAWSAELLPYRPFCQATRFNHVTGGMLRHFEPLRVDARAILYAGAERIGLDTATVWQCDVHQVRVIADGDDEGIPVPEGPHRDGHQYSLIAVSRRHNIIGGETQLLPLDEGPPLYVGTLRDGQAVVLDDRTMLHYASNVEPADGTWGYRDAWLAAFNSWDERRYGAEFERRVLAGA